MLWPSVKNKVGFDLQSNWKEKQTLTARNVISTLSMNSYRNFKQRTWHKSLSWCAMHSVWVCIRGSNSLSESYTILNNISQVLMNKVIALQNCCWPFFWTKWSHETYGMELCYLFSSLCVFLYKLVRPVYHKSVARWNSCMTVKQKVKQKASKVVNKSKLEIWLLQRWWVWTLKKFELNKGIGLWGGGSKRLRVFYKVRY